MNSNPFNSLLLTDLYQLTMLEGYYCQSMNDIAVFEFFVRKLPFQRNFMIAAGLEQVLDFLENAGFTDEERAWLHSTGRFRKDFVEYLAALRFTGDVYGMLEGTVFFPNEPILRVTAPLPEAQLVETRIINLLQFQTMIASKAIRSVLVAPDKLLVDFGLRRAHAGEAGLLAARASYLAGFTGTATVLAGRLWDIPIFGTMAHSYIQAHDNEMSAFENFANTQPNNVVLLIDTYNTELAAQKVVDLAPQLQNAGIIIQGVRLDSGDLAKHALQVRAILDAGGLKETSIFASGNLDENCLKKLISSGAPIDGFGVGTKVITSADAPYLDCAYKLMEYAGRPRRKLSEGKVTWPGCKQVYRRYEESGMFKEDELALDTDLKPGEPLLQPVMKGGRRCIRPTEDLMQIRTRVKEQVKHLPIHYKKLETSASYPVMISSSLRRLAAEVDAKLKRENLSNKESL
jgi:nicotinate phosphoribosyltransferase